MVSCYLGTGPVQALAELAGYCPLVRGLALTLATHTFAPAFAHQAPLVPAQILNIVYIVYYDSVDHVYCQHCDSCDHVSPTSDSSLLMPLQPQVGP